MEKITSGLPPLNLPLYSPYHHPSPPNSQTLISRCRPNFTVPVYINPQSIRFIVLLLYLFLPSSLYISLLSILRYPFCYLSRVSAFSLLRRSTASQFRLFFTRCIARSILLHYSCG